MNNLDFLKLLRHMVSKAHDSLPLDQRASLFALHTVINEQIRMIETYLLWAELKRDSKSSKQKKSIRGKK